MNDQISDVATKPELPARSPLHCRALNLADIRPGLKLERMSVQGDTPYNPATVISMPFRRDEKYSDSDSVVAGYLMITVETTDEDGQRVTEDWFLGDMGIVPHGTGMWSNWDLLSYTLAVE